MKNLHEQPTYNETVERIAQLTPQSTATWGKMNVGQMLCHCKKPFEVILGKKDFGFKPNILLQWLFKKSIYNDKPWRKGMPTAKGFKVVEDKDFDHEKNELLMLIDAFRAQKAAEYNHPAFGNFTQEQCGQMQYKHLDHHLKQFGA
ncbi:MAG: hypothetical protein CL868_04740 [Cytophagaceae bacterium]|nr:hypothetical protein [Cytophagaceae bacterium]|tara:strand:+ start:2805 stop:3242 length:438 start_codon:yes stop_codon:yes gene_type:complete